MEAALPIQINDCFHFYQEPTPSLPLLLSSGAFRYHLHASFPVNIFTSIGGKTDGEKKKNWAIIKWDQEVLAFEDWRLLSYSLGFTSSSSSSTLTRCFIWCGSGMFPAGFTPATAHLLRLHYYFLYSRLFMELSWVMISPCSYRTKKKKQWKLPDCFFGCVFGSNLAMFTWLVQN